MKNLTLLLSFALLFFACKTQQLTDSKPSDWELSTLEVEGLSPTPFENLEDEIKAMEFSHIDRMVLVKNGKMVLDKRYEHNYRDLSRSHASILGCGWNNCEDESQLHDYNYLHPDFHPYYQGRDVHSLQSVTKSVTATLIGIALQQGKLESLDQKLLSFLDDYDLSETDPRLKKATLHDLLTMRTGIEWHEQDRPIDSTNTTMQLELSQDWVQFTLDQPMDAAPGEKWAYSSGGSHLMSAVIKKATGKYVDEYAKEHLFGPLGIKDFHWKKTPKGLPDTEGGLFLSPYDLAKIGQLHLQDGMWKGQRILPEGWAKEATALHVEEVNQFGWGYGFQWWRLDRQGLKVWAGLGFGGQYLVIFPELNAVGVVNSWNLFKSPKKPMLYAFLEAIIEAHK